MWFFWRLRHNLSPFSCKMLNVYWWLLCSAAFSSDHVCSMLHKHVKKNRKTCESLLKQLLSRCSHSENHVQPSPHTALPSGIRGCCSSAIISWIYFELLKVWLRKGENHLDMLPNPEKYICAKQTLFDNWYNWGFLHFYFNKHFVLITEKWNTNRGQPNLCCALKIAFF